MRILSKYVLHEFAVFLMYSVLAFIAVFILVDVVEVMDRFIDRQLGVHLIILYYLFYLPYIVVLTLPVAMLLTTMFSLGRLVGDNEITAIKASGISLHRILLPLYAFALVMGLVVMGMSEYVVPNTNRYREDIDTQGNEFRFSLLRNRELDQSFVFVLNGEHSIVYARDYSSRRQMATGVFVVEPYPGTMALDDGIEMDIRTIRRRIDAEYMTYEDGRWTMINAEVREFTGEGEVLEQYESLSAKFITATPSDFARIDIKPEEMNYLQLSTHIDTIRDNGGDPSSLLVEKHLKLSFPFVSFVIVFFGAPLAAGSSKRGKASSFGIALVICFIFYALIHTFQILGRNGSIDPLFAAWFPNSFFFVLGLGMHLTTNR